MAAPRRRPNSGNLFKKDLNTWPEDSTTRTTCLSSFPTYSCLPFTSYDSMASISKLVLVPIDTWHRLSKDRKDIDVHSIKTVDIPLLSKPIQQWWGQCECTATTTGPSSSAGGSGGGGGKLFLPSLLPPSPPHKEKGRRRREKGRRGNPCTLIEKIWARRRHPVR